MGKSFKQNDKYGNVSRDAVKHKAKGIRVQRDFLGQEKSFTGKDRVDLWRLSKQNKVNDNE